MTLGKVLTIALMGVAIPQPVTSTAGGGRIRWEVIANQGARQEPYDNYLRRAGGRALMTGARLLPGSAAGGRPVWARSSRLKGATDPGFTGRMSLIFSRIFRMMSTPARLTPRSRVR